MAIRACLDKKMEENICGKKTLQSCGKLKVLDFFMCKSSVLKMFPPPRAPNGEVKSRGVAR